MSTSAIVTASGRVIDPINPDPDDILIEDIAHSLGNSCRFTGHVREFYSVAEHSVRMVELVGGEYARDVLLHDASEAYLSDIARPLKKYSRLGDLYEEVEDRLMEVISYKFDIEWPLCERVKWADEEMLKAEIRDLLPQVDDDRLLQWDAESVYERRIEPWKPYVAIGAFLYNYWRCT